MAASKTKLRVIPGNATPKPMKFAVPEDRDFLLKMLMMAYPEAQIILSEEHHFGHGKYGDGSIWRQVKMDGDAIFEEHGSWESWEHAFQNFLVSVRQHHSVSFFERLEKIIREA